MRGRLLADFTAYYVALSALAGLLIGSFLNVCIYRIPRDMSVVKPRSFCPECGSAIAWHDNIPLLSYLVLRGRCRACKQAIPASYPLVELSTSLLFGLVAFEYGWTLAALKWFVFQALLVALFWIDLEERILPDELTLGGVAAGLLFAVFVMVPSAAGELLRPSAKPALQSLLSAAVAAIVLVIPIWALAKAYSFVRKRDALGAGDVKLLLLISVFLGLERGLFAMLVGTVGGTILGAAYLLAARRNPATYELPFGTFLCAGASLAPLLTRSI